MNEKFDSVGTMRRIRDSLSRKFAKMTYDEQKAYMRKRLGKA
jgi:hypothetical protein